MQRGERFALVALREIAPGEEIVHSYLRAEMLMEPRAMRTKRLESWFSVCWCTRCASRSDDVRCLPCEAPGCAGVCAVLHRGALGKCSSCEASPASADALLRLEEKLLDKYLSYERDQANITEKGVHALLQLAERSLAHGHWMRAAIGDLAQDVLTQVGMQCTDRPAAEGRALLERALELNQEWCACWHTNLPFPAPRVAVKHERAADLLTVLGRFPAAVEHYLSARSVLASLATPCTDGRVERIERKLRRALDGERNDKDLAC